MADQTGIEWTDATWNPVVGCGTELLYQPLRWKRPRRIFVNSMSDLFHEDVPFEFIAAVFRVMAAAPQHTFQVLTKRPDRMHSLLSMDRFWIDVAKASIPLAPDRGGKVRQVR